MNEPRVLSLIYNIEHADSADFSVSPSVERDMEDFQVRTQDGQVRFKLKKHCSTVDEARQMVEKYINDWELDAFLEEPRDEFRLSFCHPEVVARSPIQGAHVVHPHPVNWHINVSEVTGTSHKAIPRPPTELTLAFDDKEVVYLRARMKNYYRHPRDLPALADLCVTTLQEPFRTDYPSKKLRKAAAHYAVSKRVLREVLNLAANKGGPDEARKAQGAAEGKELSGVERRFLEAAVLLIIRRLAEKKRCPTQSFCVIGMDDLPQLPSDKLPARKNSF